MRLVRSRYSEVWLRRATSARPSTFPFWLSAAMRQSLRARGVMWTQCRDRRGGNPRATRTAMTAHQELSSSGTNGGGSRRRMWAWGALGVIVAFVTCVDVTITGPRVSVRWQEAVSAGDRVALERRHDLQNGVQDGRTWQYELGDRTRENIRALVEDPAVEDTGRIDRNTFISDGRDIRVTVWYPFNDLFDRPSQLLRLHRSLWLLLAGGVLLWAARTLGARARRNVTAAALLLVGAMAVAFPFSPSQVTMGGSSDHVRSRADFESWFGGRVRFEKHLSQTMLLQLYLQLDATEAAPERAVVAMSRGATVWFVLAALLIGFLERWSVVVIRYLGLVLLAPATLLYFGWREFGYLSLCVAVFPLLSRGMKAGGALAGLGAALHGAGLVSLVGACLMALGTDGQLRDRVERVVRVVAWGTAAYLGWMLVYVVVLNLRVEPSAETFSSWRPWLIDEVRERRVSAAILSATGARDIVMSAWVAGAPLLVAALSLRGYAHEVRAALWYILPSVLFLILRWPFEGVGGGIDLVFAGFPALYALAWVCAHDPRRTKIAAVLLISAHYAFWRMVLDDQFLPLRTD